MIRIPTGQRIYLSYMDEVKNPDGSISDDIDVVKSTDGGLTWPEDLDMTQGKPARRFLPAICATNGNLFVSWYDCRNATPAAQDLTSYYWATVLDQGTLALGTEVNASGGKDDPECISGIALAGLRLSGRRGLAAFGTVDRNDLPRFGVAGRCDTAVSVFPPIPAWGVACAEASRQCDFRTGVGAACPADANANFVRGLIGLPPQAIQEQCRAALGAPKYGDYNGAACAGGKLYMAWASSTPPAGTCGLRGSACTQDEDCCAGENCINDTCVVGTTPRAPVGSPAAALAMR